jgi:hypothetical protein
MFIIGDIKLTMIAAIVSALILLPIVLHFVNSSSFEDSSSNQAAPLRSHDSSSFDIDPVSMITDFQAEHGFKKMGSAGFQMDDTAEFVIGQQSLKLSTNGDGIAVFTRKIDISPAIDLTNSSLKIWLKVSDVQNIKELRVTVTGDRFQTLRNYWIYTSDGSISTPLNDDEWTLLTIESQNIRDFANPDLSKIDTIQLRVADDSSGALSVWFNGLGIN